MGKKEQSIYDIVEYAKKYSVKDAALAYSVSQASVYRYLSIRISEKSNKEATQHLQPVVLLDFKSHLLIPEKIYRKKLIPGLYLLTAFDVNQNNFYYALSSENNKSNTQYFLNYLYNKINLCSPNIIIKNCCNETNISIKSYRKWQIPVEIVTSLTDSIAHSEQTDLRAVIFGNQILNNSAEILPITITAANINEFNRYLNKDQLWQETNINTPELFFKSCEYLVNKAGDLFIKGETEKAMAIAEKVITTLESNDNNKEINKLVYQTCLLLAKANSYKNYYELATEYFNKAIQACPDLGEAYYQFSVFLLSADKKEEARNQLLLAQKAYKNTDSIEAACRYYEVLGKLYYQHDNNLRNAVINFKKMKDEAIGIDDSNLIFEANGYLANLYYIKQSYELAEELYAENVKLSQGMQDKIKQSTALYNVAVLNIAVGKYEQAEKNISDSLAIAKKGQDFYKTMHCQLTYARILLYRGKLNASLKNYQKTVQDFLEPSKNNKLLVDAYNNIASIYKQQSQYKKSISFFSKAIATEAKINSDSYRPYIFSQLAEIYLYKNDNNKAIEFYNKVLKISYAKKELKEIRAFAAYNLGKILLQEQQFKRAIEHFTESDSIFQFLHLHTGLERYKIMRNEIFPLLTAKNI